MKIIGLLGLFSFIVFGQVEPSKGLRSNPPRVWALKGANVHTEPNKILEDAIIIVRDGMIEKVGVEITIPKDVTILDLSGKTIYPGFIDSWVEIPVQSQDKTEHDAHWNHKVHARRDLSGLYTPDKKKLESLHRLGFTAAHIVPDSGVFQGQTSLVQLDDEGTILQRNIAQNITYEVDGWGSDQYPNALLGVVALIRQTLLDAAWYDRATEQTKKYPSVNVPLKQNRDLEVLGSWLDNNKPFVIETNNELAALRSFNIAEEFNLNCWLLGSGYEYRRINEIAEKKPFIILPLDFPSTPDMSNPYQELRYSTSELKHWDMAPDNPAVLLENDISFAITSHKLEGKEFRKNLNKSVERSLSTSSALAALTTEPAKMMGMENKLGKIKRGYLANLTILDGDYFDDTSEIISIWVGGKEYPVQPKYDVSIEGNWKLAIGDKSYRLELKKKSKKYSGTILQDTTEFKLSKLKVKGRFISWQVQWDSTTTANRFTGHILEDSLEGISHDQNLQWSAIKTGKREIEKGIVTYSKGAIIIVMEIR